MYIDRHLFPLYQFQVGTEQHAAKINTQGVSEIDEMEAKMGDLASEGTIYTSERHKVTVIGVEGKGIQIQPFLDYYKGRAIMSLGMSTVDFGEGGTSNRGTASVISRSLVDICKSYQDITAEALTFSLIYPLMMEGGFDPFDPNQEVRLRFNEIDTEEKRAKELHSMLQYQNDGIDHPEYRADQGRKSFTDEQWGMTYTEQTHKRRSEIDGDKKSRLQSESAQQKEALVKAKPTNQFGSKAKPKNPKNDIEASVYTSLIYARQKYINTCAAGDSQKAGKDILSEIENKIMSIYSKTYANSTLSKDNFLKTVKDSITMKMVSNRLSGTTGLPSTNISYALVCAKKISEEINNSLATARDNEEWDMI